MNSPARFYQYERALDPFVNAAQTTALTSACDVLYMHGSDLTWGESKQDLFLVDMNDYGGFNEVYNEYFDAESGPARTTVGVKELPSVCSIPPEPLIRIHSILF